MEDIDIKRKGNAKKLKDSLYLILEKNLRNWDRNFITGNEYVYS